MIISDIQNLPLDISFKKLYASPKTPKAKMTAYHGKNKANLRDLIAATGLVILLKLDSNRRFFIKLCASSQTPGWIKTGVTVRKRSIRVKIADFFVPCDLEIWWMTLKNDRTPLLCYIKLYASFQSHQWIQTGVTARKRSIWVKIGNCFIPCDLEIWWMTLKNHRAPLLCCFKLCASFHNHWWILTEVTVRKRSIQVKISDLLSCVTLKFNGWHWKTIEHLFYAASSFMHHNIAIGEFKLKLQSGNAQFGSKSAIFCPVWPWYLTNDLEKQ